MSLKYVDVDIELSDAEDFIKYANESELKELSDAVTNRFRELNIKPQPDPFETETFLRCDYRNAPQQLACTELQDLINQLGPEEIVKRIKAA